MRAKVTSVLSLLFLLAWPTLGTPLFCGACAALAPEVSIAIGAADHSCCKEASPASEHAIQKGHCCWYCVYDSATNANLSRRTMILTKSESAAYPSKANGVKTVRAAGRADSSSPPPFWDTSPHYIPLKLSSLYLFDCIFRI